MSSPRRPGTRSSRWFCKTDLPGFVHRSTLSTCGWHKQDFLSRPVVGILNTWSDINPCNLNLRQLAGHVRAGILEAGAIPFELPLLSLSENLIKPTSFLFRNLLAMEAEEAIRAYPFDAVVLLGGCDKTIPALLMGATSVNVPAIVLSSGPRVARSMTGGALATGTGVWRFVDGLRAGSLCSREFEAFESNTMGTAGHCNEMGTATSIAALCEALGMTLSGSSLIPADDGRRITIARKVGHTAAKMALTGGPRPRDILSLQAFDNAMTLLCALGGSTNAIIHMLALAGRAGVALDLERIDLIARRVPLVVNVQPAGEFLTSRLMEAGGIAAVLNKLAPLLNLDVPTVENVLLGELIARANATDPQVISDLHTPFKSGETLVVLKGNLAPGGAVLKACAASPSLFSHRGRAVVFEDVQTLADRIDDPDLKIEASSVLVLRNAGPVGAAMPEWGMLPIPRRLLERGVRDMVRISDARMSGTAYGTAILHVAPEAAVGGPLGLIQTGDYIELDVHKRLLNVDLGPAELEHRRKQVSSKKHARGYRSLYAAHVLQADTGCDFDFLRGSDSDSLPEGLFDGWVGGW